MFRGKVYLVVLYIIGTTGCQSAKVNLHLEPTVFEALRTSEPIQIDGRLSEAVWQDAESIPLIVSRANMKAGNPTEELGSVRFAWDEDNVYLAASMCDSDLVAEGIGDQESHWQKGDVLEWFLKPENETWYWELYVTPNGLKTSYWFPGRGRLGIPSSLDYSCGLRVAVRTDGSLNDWKDKDTGWTAEMAMHRKDLTARGESFGAGSSWRVLVGRYNYSRYLDGVELTMAPQLSTNNFHHLGQYATLRFVDK